eukprot:720742-Ditylum_brightwellii.AAC.1
MVGCIDAVVQQHEEKVGEYKWARERFGSNRSCASIESEISELTFQDFEDSSIVTDKTDSAEVRKCRVKRDGIRKDPQTGRAPLI